MKKMVYCSMLFVFFTAGCATKSAFVYDYPSQSQAGAERIAYISALKDDRKDKDIDHFYQKEPLEDVQEVIKQEVRSTGLFKEALILPAGKMPDTMESYLLLEPSINRFAWASESFLTTIPESIRFSLLKQQWNR